MSTSKTSWASLPPEIRNRILKFLLYDGCSLAGLAAVSREWQAVIEPHNFARIDLTPSSLLKSGPILYRKRKLIHYIWYRLELLPYTCSFCTSELDDYGMSDPDSLFVSEAFQGLCSALNLWEPNGDLVLDVSVYSPSDPEHCFKYLDFRPDIPSGKPPFRLRYNESSSSSWTPPHDPSHGWVDGRQATAPGYGCIDKVFDEIMSEGPFEDEEQEMEWWQRLPSIPAITGILFRQQNRRRWKPRALANMLTRFPKLNEICYEPWREWGYPAHLTDIHNKTLFESLNARKSLRKLVIFENFDQQYPRVFDRAANIRAPNSVLSLTLVKPSLQLEVLSASFMVDARDFFKQAACQKSWKWQNLTTLALTSKRLNPDTSTADIDDMLLDAATTALNMPKLGTMELWNAKEGLAILFRYQRARDGQSAIITLRGTFGLTLRHAVAE